MLAADVLHGGPGGGQGEVGKEGDGPERESHHDGRVKGERGEIRSGREEAREG